MSGGVPIFVTDLDGTLLDEDTYESAQARPGLDALQAAGAGLVLCSSKTRAEMVPLVGELGLDRHLGAPLIVENGGAIVVSARLIASVPPGAAREGDDVIVPLGTPRATLLTRLPEIAAAAGVTVRAFAVMSLDEVAALTGLAPEAAARSMRREWDEPFVVETGADAGTDARLAKAARERGLCVTRGRHLHHLSGSGDKGAALRVLLRLLAPDPHESTVGLGDAPNDVPMLRVVDRPIVIPHRDDGIHPTLAAELPGAERAPEPGPAGWAAAVVTVLSGGTLPRVGA